MGRERPAAADGAGGGGAVLAELAFEIEVPAGANGDRTGIGGGVAANGFQPRLRLADGFLRGRSQCMEALLEELTPLAASLIPILLSGETGTGKELIARTIHRSSPRSSKPFVAINCAAIPAELLEPELFGIEKGAATGVNARPGKFVEADGGTLFLDEVGEMPDALQAKLLRALQEEEVQPVGGRPRAIDVRVVSATNADVEAQVEKRHFRPDLFYRLAGTVLRIPPLRERVEDVRALIEAFLRRYAQEAGKRRLAMTVGALERLTSFDWPGNVRELQNEVRRLAHVGEEGGVIDIEHLSIGARLPATHGVSPACVASRESLELAPRVAEVERALIEAALRRTRGNRSRAARMLGISRNTLADKIGKLEVEVS